MIGIVLVSHSKALATAVRDLVLQMVRPDFPVIVAAGVGDDHEEIGTDAVHISEMIRPFCDGDGAVVLMDLGSAVLSAQTALELLEAEDVPDVGAKIRLCPAPIVEAAVAAAVQSESGAGLDAVFAEAMSALAPKQDQLGMAEVTQSPSAAGDSLAADVEFEVEIENPHGLHARPAATLVQAATRFVSDIRLTNMTAARGPASVRSLSGIGLLQVRCGNRVRFSIRGEDAAKAEAALRQLAAGHFGESLTAAPEPVVVGIAAAETSVTGTGGIASSDGIALGRPLLLAAALPELAAGDIGTPEQERRKFDEALRQVAEQIRRGSRDNDNATAQIFAAQALLLSDPALIEPAHARLTAGGVSALEAWRDVSLAVADDYAAMADDYLQARAADIRDIAAHVMRVLAGESHTARIAPEPPAILLTDELLPSEAMACDPERVLGILARAGSPTAHAAIIARTLGIPMVVGAKSVDLRELSGLSAVAIDGATGEIWLEPTPAQRGEILERRRAFLARRAADEADKTRPAVTSDGVAIEVLANVGTAADAAAARENGAEGVGLLRTEFVYLSFSDMPGEERQVQSLADILANLGSGPVVIRTPDIGADKPLPFMPPMQEHNPFLGVRGIRLSLRYPDFFASNLRAILRAGVGRDLWIMVPMVTDPEEMVQARACVEAAHQALDRTGTPHCWPIKLGMMVEVPAAALLAERFAAVADFFSIGTNDLTQYLLAAERGNGELESLQDAAHPAVLQAVAALCAQADVAGRHVSVCGDAASDPVAASLLIGAGVRSLSVRPNQIAAIKAQLRRQSCDALRALTQEAMTLGGSGDVRRLVHDRLGA